MHNKNPLNCCINVKGCMWHRSFVISICERRCALIGCGMVWIKEKKRNLHIQEKCSVLCGLQLGEKILLVGCETNLMNVKNMKGSLEQTCAVSWLSREQCDIVHTLYFHLVCYLPLWFFVSAGMETKEQCGPFQSNLLEQNGSVCVHAYHRARQQDQCLTATVHNARCLWSGRALPNCRATTTCAPMSPRPLL